jgi:acetyl-CoA acetyltransferase
MDSGRVAIIKGKRTPFVKAGTVYKKYSALDLGVHAVTGLLHDCPVPVADIDELVFGTVIFDPQIPNIAREIIFNTELPEQVKAYTVSNNCITGIHAITAIYETITSGRAEIGIAGGTESMSNPPILFSLRSRNHPPDCLWGSTLRSWQKSGR